MTKAKSNKGCLREFFEDILGCGPPSGAAFIITIATAVALVRRRRR